MSFRIQNGSVDLTDTEPGLSPLSAHLLYPETASCGWQIAVFASDLAATQRFGRLDTTCRGNSKSLANLLCAYAVPGDARARTVRPRVQIPGSRPTRCGAAVAAGRYDTGVSDDLPRRWLEYQRTSREEMFDAWIQVDSAVREDPKEGWRLVLELVRLAAGDPVALSSIGAGPLEDLVRFHPNPFLDIAEAEARRNPPLADALRGTRYPGHGL